MSDLRAVALGAAAATCAFIAYVLALGLTTTGRHLAVVGVLRLALLPLLIAIAAGAGSALAAWGSRLAAAGAVATVGGAVALVALDGWAHNPFAVAGASPPWYAFVIGLGAFAFAGGTLLVGAALLRTGAPPLLAWTAVAAGVLYLPAIPLASAGHLIWAAAWLGVSLVAFATARADDARVAPAAKVTTR